MKTIYKLIIATQIGMIIGDIISVKLFDCDISITIQNHTAATIGYLLLAFQLWILNDKL